MANQPATGASGLGSGAWCQPARGRGRGWGIQPAGRAAGERVPEPARREDWGVRPRAAEYGGGREPASGKGGGRGGGEARQCAGRAAGAASSFRPEVGRRD